MHDLIRPCFLGIRFAPVVAMNVRSDGPEIGRETRKVKPDGDRERIAVRLRTNPGEPEKIDTCTAYLSIDIFFFIPEADDMLHFSFFVEINFDQASKGLYKKNVLPLVAPLSRHLKACRRRRHWS